MGESDLIGNTSTNIELVEIIKEQPMSSLPLIKKAFNMLAKKAFCCRRAIELMNE